MKVTTVKYEKLVNLGDYQNERVGVEVLVEEADTVEDSFRHARQAVYAAIEARRREDEERAKAEAEAREAKQREWAQGVLDKHHAYSRWDVGRAAAILGVQVPGLEGSDETRKAPDDIPF